MAQSIQGIPEEAHNQTFVSHHLSPDWGNSEPTPRYTLVVIVGVGTASLIM